MAPGKLRYQLDLGPICPGLQRYMIHESSTGRIVAKNSEQKLPLLALTGMVVGSMVGSGIFSLPRTFGNATGPFGAIIAWTIAAGGMYTLARVFQAGRNSAQRTIGPQANRLSNPIFYNRNAPFKNKDKPRGEIVVATCVWMLATILASSIDTVVDGACT